MDFKNGKGNFYLGNPPSGSNDALACKIKMTEKDFHRILDSELGVKKAIISRRLKIEGGASGVNNAYKLLNDFLNPYLFDTWGQTEILEDVMTKKIEINNIEDAKMFAPNSTS